jgi:P-type Mg2+ transporter
MIAFPQARPSGASVALTLTTFAIMTIDMWLPHSSLLTALGLTHLPHMYWPILLLTLLGYMALTQVVKVRLLRAHWI